MKKDSGAMFGYLCRQNQPFMCVDSMGLEANREEIPTGLKKPNAPIR
ncbi:MAG: hypothetical protein KGO92_12745 [Bacteroidota bacterium]|nr:hypothetical protein [Bacteroidota bacterium]